MFSQFFLFFSCPCTSLQFVFDVPVFCLSSSCLNLCFVLVFFLFLVVVLSFPSMSLQCSFDAPPCCFLGAFSCKDHPKEGEKDSTTQKREGAKQDHPKRERESNTRKKEGVLLYCRGSLGTVDCLSCRVFEVLSGALSSFAVWAVLFSVACVLVSGVGSPVPLLFLVGSWCFGSSWRLGSCFLLVLASLFRVVLLFVLSPCGWCWLECFLPSSVLAVALSLLSPFGRW